MNKKAFWVFFCIGLFFLVCSFMAKLKKADDFTVLAAALLGSSVCFGFAGAYAGAGMRRVNLPHEGKFQRITEFRSGSWVLLTLCSLDPPADEPEEAKFYKLPAGILLDPKGDLLWAVPEKFGVCVSQRIKPGDRSRRPKKQKVYYLTAQ